MVVQPRGAPGSIVSTVGRGGFNVTLADGVVLNDDGRPAPVVHQFDRVFKLACTNEKLMGGCGESGRRTASAREWHTLVRRGNKAGGI